MENFPETHVPDENFINRAKQAGLKFTFGTAATKTLPTSITATKWLKSAD